MARKEPGCRTKTKSYVLDSPAARSAGGLRELGSALLLVADALLGMISTLVFGVVLELVVLLPAFVFQTLALSSAFFVTSASAPVTCLHKSNANFLFVEALGGGGGGGGNLEWTTRGVEGGCAQPGP